MANRLKELRRRTLLTQKELAAAIGVEYQTVQRWENGTRSPRPAQLRKLCEVFGVTPDELLAALEGESAEGKAAA
jgi:transcriptional regulator with XRE-family HTH domain